MTKLLGLGRQGANEGLQSSRGDEHCLLSWMQCPYWMKGQVCRAWWLDREQMRREVNQRCHFSGLFAFSFLKYYFHKLNLYLLGHSLESLLCFKVRKTHHTVGNTPVRNGFLNGRVTWGNIRHGLTCVPWPICAYLDPLPISCLKACLVWTPSG